ncbi:MAG: dehydratase [Mycobacterium sp.]|nr:dehydratase [Mycobacterium sp.]
MAGGVANLIRAAAGSLPFVRRGQSLPERTLTVDEVTIDRDNVAAYAAVTGLRYGADVPLTYPTVMELVTGFDFPFAALGAVHVENTITQHRPIAVTDTVGVRVRVDNLREHRRGLLVDVISRVCVGTEPAWDQVTTFLHLQRTSLSGQPAPESPPRERLPAPNAVLRITAKQIRRYSSVGADHNPIHTSAVAAKLFGFPSPIAHGMFTAAAVLANIEGQLPAAVTYAVRFGKPVLLPATVGVYTERADDGWDICLRDMAKGYPHLTSTVRPLG